MTKITVQTSIQAHVSKVWEFFTESEHIVNWNFATQDWECPSAESDLQEQGKFSYRMSAKNGSMAFDFEWVYEEIISEKYLKYRLWFEESFDIPTRYVEVHFENLWNSTRIVETFDIEDENTIEQQKQGWQEILDNFKTYAESK